VIPSGAKELVTMGKGGGGGGMDYNPNCKIGLGPNALWWGLSPNVGPHF